MAGGDLT
ncbi:hypothetical protein YPPY06_0400, partial [Yersinia pestis PY-06]